MTGEYIFSLWLTCVFCQSSQFLSIQKNVFRHGSNSLLFNFIKLSILRKFKILKKLWFFSNPFSFILRLLLDETFWNHPFFRIRHVTHLIVMDRFQRRNITFIIGGRMWTVDGRTDGQKSVHRGLSTRMVSVTSNDLRVWIILYDYPTVQSYPKCFRVPLL